MARNNVGGLVAIAAGVVLLGVLLRAISGALAIARDEVLYRAFEGRVRTKP